MFLVLLIGKVYGSIEFINKKTEGTESVINDDCFIETYSEAVGLLRRLRPVYENIQYKEKFDYFLDVKSSKDIVKTLSKKKLNSILTGLTLASEDA